MSDSYVQMGPRRYYFYLDGEGEFTECAADEAKLKADPEMYEALRRIEATLIAGEVGRSVGRYSFPANGDTAAALRAALAKADGKEQKP